VKNEKFINNNTMKIHLPFHFAQGLWSSGESHFEVDLVLFIARATVDHFACRSDQVDVHPFFFQTHGFTFILIASFILKYEALSCPK
jgi:hypothetical protein